MLLTARDAALQANNLERFVELHRKLGGGAFSSQGAALCAFHKTRYEVVSIPAALREESRVWLQARGFGRFRGLPWPIDGELEQ